MRILRKAAAFLVAALTMSASVAPAYADSFSISSAALSPISMSNTIYSKIFPVGTTSTHQVNSVLYTKLYQTTTYTISARVCGTYNAKTYCSSWSTANSLTVTGWPVGMPANTAFTVQTQVQISPTTTAKVISPTIYANGNSSVTVGYTS